MKTEETGLGHLWRERSTPYGLLPDGAVHVWRFGLDVSEVALRRFRETLCETETVRADRFRLPTLRRRFVAGRGALRFILAGYLSMEPRQVTFSYGPYGKPSVANSPNGIEFNLSHSNDLMAVAACRRRSVGIDIEKENAQFQPREIAGRYFCEQEKKEMAQADDETALRTFFQLWTAKEAVTKATALGLSLELSKVEIGLNPLRVLGLEAAGSARAMDWRLFAFSPGEGFVGTLAVTGEPAHLEYISLCLR